MATPEGKVKRRLDTMLKQEEVFFFSPQAGPYGRAGIPDRIACVCGLFIGIEAKAGLEGRPTALQLRCMKEICAAGGAWFLIYDDASIEVLRQFIRNVRTCSSRQEGTHSSIA